MYLGLLSDTHNDQQKVKAALQIYQERGITTVLHAGDVTNVATLKLFASFDLWIAQGNMDRDPALRETTKELFGSGRMRMRMQHELTLNGSRIALLHGDVGRQLDAVMHDPRYDYIIHGHTHIPLDKKIAETGARLINPGALGQSRWRAATCAILNTRTDDLEWLRF